MKRITLYFLLIVMSLILVGCKSDEEPDEKVTAPKYAYRVLVFADIQRRTPVAPSLIFAAAYEVEVLYTLDAETVAVNAIFSVAILGLISDWSRFDTVGQLSKESLTPSPSVSIDTSI